MQENFCVRHPFSDWSAYIIFLRHCLSIHTDDSDDSITNSMRRKIIHIWYLAPLSNRVAVPVSSVYCNILSANGQIRTSVPSASHKISSSHQIPSGVLCWNFSAHCRYYIPLNSENINSEMGASLSRLDTFLIISILY